MITENMKKYEALHVELIALRKKNAEEISEISHLNTESVEYRNAVDELDASEDSLLDQMDALWREELSEDDIRLINLRFFENTVLELLENSFGVDPELAFKSREGLRETSVVINWFFDELWRQFVEALKAGEVGEKIDHLGLVVDFDGVHRESD